MDKETIIIASEDVEIIDASEYKEELSEHFGRVPEVAKPLLKVAETVFFPNREVIIYCTGLY